MMKRLFLSITLIALSLFVAAAEASITTTGDAQSRTWVLENNRMQWTIDFTEGKGITLTLLQAKEANTKLAGTGSRFFEYTGRFLPLHEGAEASTFTLKSTDAAWTLATDSVQDILLSSALPDSVIGRTLSIRLERPNVAVTLNFELYADDGGLRYQTFIQNLSEESELLIERSVVLKMDFSNRLHNIHYITNNKWLSTNGTITEPANDKKGNDVPRLLLCRYDNGYGWYMAPETNWKTQYGPEKPNDQSSPSYNYMMRPFAVSTAWATSNSDGVKVQTCPESFQLLLRPGEEFEYVAVNLTAFQGDIVDGKMAVEEHLRRRFRYHHTTTSMMINDWDWFTAGLRTENFFYNTVLPQAKLGGYDMLLIDDGWNNSAGNGTSLDQSGTSRDAITSNTPGIPSMRTFARNVLKNGLRLGLWYSNSGGGHNRGNDLANPSVISAKRQMIEKMIADYGMSHQAVDLTEYWQNLDVTSYSSPCDNVYRKAVLTRNMMNDIVTSHPEFEIKVTSEVDIFPTQGDRQTELLHLPYNGWLTTTGAGSNLETIGMNFGHLPLSSIYFGGEPTTKTSVLYALLCGRNVKSKTRPDKWAREDLQQMRMLNDWRKSPRVMALTDRQMRPVYLGEGWDDKDASKWTAMDGVYMWMFTDAERSTALLLASCGNQSSVVGPRSYPLRWLAPDKRYAVADVTLDDKGYFTYAFKTCATGQTLNTQGLSVDLLENSSSAKAYWLKEVTDVPLQVIFADEKVRSWEERYEGGTLNITAQGTPNSDGTILVYGTKENDAMHLVLHFDADGQAEASLSSITNNDVPFPGPSDVTVRYEFEDYHDGLIKSNSGITAASYYNGNPDSEGGYSSVMTMTAIGDYVIYTLPLPMPGRYEVTLNYKTSKSSRGTARFSFLDASDAETKFAQVDESTTTDEKMITLNAGTYDLTEQGRVRIKMQLVSGGKLIGANYIKLHRVN